MVDSIVGGVAATVTGCLLDPITRQFGYLFNYRRNITDLNQKIQSLHLEKERLQIDVDAANRQGDVIYPDVQAWLTYAEGIIQNRNDFNEDETKARKSCFYFKSRYRLSKQAKRDAEEIAAKINHNFGDRVSYRPPPTSVLPFISSSSFKDYEALESRESTFNQIMEALRNEEMRMIGVWGMGGVGKTTLVKQVAKQSEEQKLFHKVIIVLDITEKPDISEIQGRIASQFGTKFEADEDRAARVRQMLKKVEKILVILDDIWGKLDLGKIGIPYDEDYHKGCKVLLTSRKLPVLSKDMGIQEQFCFFLQHLSHPEAWNLFTKIAGDSVESHELRPTAVDVAKECGGLPVAIVTVAKALGGEKNPAVWRNALKELKTSTPVNIEGVDEKVYSCLQLSYNHLKSDEAKSLFLLCSLVGDGDISMYRLLQYAMGLNLFKGLYSWEKAVDRLITLVKNLEVSSLLLDNRADIHDYLDGRNLLFDEGFVRMHDVVRDVARSIASKDPHPFVVKEGVELREWQRTDECRNCSRMSLVCRNMDELARGLVCPQLEFFLLNSSNYLKIPNDFFLDTKQLRVLGLYSASLALSPSSFGFLSNLQTLCLNKCKLQDIAVIGKLKRLQILNLARSEIKQLPKEMMELSDLRVLDLQYCQSLQVIPRNVISSLSQLEYLSMKQCFRFKWDPVGLNSGERNNACLSELKHLSGLRTLEVEVSHLSLLPKDDVVFDNLINLTRYSIAIGSNSPMWFGYKATRRLVLVVESFQKVKSFSNLLKKSQCAHLGRLKDTKDVVYELDKDSFEELEYLRIYYSPAIHSIPCNAFAKESFVNLRVLKLEDCERLKYVFSLPPNGRESDFPQLQSLTLQCLNQLISFYSTGSSCCQESTTLFNQKAAFPALESLDISSLLDVKALWHNQLPAHSFSKLKTLDLHDCDKLLNVFPLSVAKALLQLEDLIIENCGVLETVVANEDEDENEDETTHLFPKLSSLQLWGLYQLKRFCSRRFTSRRPLLKIQKVSQEDEIDIEIQEPFFLVEKAAFPALESLDISSLHDHVKALWLNQLPAHSFSKLKTLYLHDCNKLLNVFPLFVAKALLQLEKLNISSCGVLETVVANEDEDEDEDETTPLFPKLTSLKLSELHQLKRFCSRRFASRPPLLKIQKVSQEDEIDIEIQEPFFLVEKVSFPSLELLIIKGLSNVKALWYNELLEDSFSKLKRLEISRCDKLLNLFPSNIFKGLQSLQILEINKCDALEEIFDLKGINGKETEDITTTQSGNNLFYKDIQGLSIFQNLQSFKVIGCPRLKYVFPVSVAKTLMRLQDLLIDCCGVETIVASEGEDEAMLSFPFPKLTSLKFVKLPQLKTFCFGRFTLTWPLLKELEMSDCDKVEILFHGMGLKDDLDDKIQQSLFLVEKGAFPDLEKLTISGNVEIWRGQFSRMPFSKLRVLKMSKHGGISIETSLSIVQKLQNLERLEVEKCNSVNEIIQKEWFSTLPRLTEIRLEDLPKLMDLSGLDLLFHNLQTLEVVGCESLINLLTPSTTKRLVQQLKKLIIGRCNKVKEIFVGNEGDEQITDGIEIEFTSLNNLSLLYLPNLKSFCSAKYTFRFPSLEEIKVEGCSEMECFCNGVLFTPRLEYEGIYYSLQEYWESDLNTSIYKMFMNKNARGYDEEDSEE